MDDGTCWPRSGHLDNMHGLQYDLHQMYFKFGRVPRTLLVGMYNISGYLVSRASLLSWVGMHCGFLTWGIISWF